MFFEKKFRPGKDETIVRRYQRGDTAEISALIRRYESSVYNMCYRQCLKMTGGSSAGYQAEDLSQEVWRKVFLNIQSYKPVSPFSAWLTTITKNTAKDWLKKAYLHHEVPENRLAGSHDKEGGRAYTDGAGVLNKDYVSSEDYAVRKNARDILDICHQRLAPDARSMITLYMDDTSQRDMASAFKVSLGTINNRIKSVFMELKTCMENQGISSQDIIACLDM